VTVGFAVGFAVVLAVEVGFALTVGFAVALVVGDGLGDFVAACAALPDIASAIARKSESFLNRAPT
jgi:hypothetical protein